MAKKIIITFNEEPIPGVAFDYTIQVNGLALVYPSGSTSVNFDYRAYLSPDDPTKVEIQNNTSLTINATLAFLVANYSTTGISYAKVNNTIEVSINIDSSDIVVYIGGLNPNLSITTTDISNISTVGLKYFFEYKNIVNDTYLCEIFKKDYTGEFTEIHGFVTIEKASVINHLDAIRGGGVSLELEASKDVTLEDLYSENEQDFSVKVYKNKKLIFQGFLNPDGVYQDFVLDEWKIKLDCVDGLGAISNLSFVQPNGLHFTGKILAIDIIYNCLKRTGILMPINTSVNIYYEGLDIDHDTNDVLSRIKLNTDRFVRTDNDTIMSCEDVLKSILDIFKAVITQQDGEWYIYKPNEIFVEPYVVFKRFDITNNFIGEKTVNLNKNLGSQIDNFYPHHCGANQRVEIKGSVGGFRLGYKYGFVAGLLPNPNLEKNGSSLSYDGWDVNDSYQLLNDPLKDSGFLFKNNAFTPSSVITVISDALEVTVDDDLSLKMSFNITSDFGGSFFKMQIKVGSYYLKYAPKNDQTPLEDTKNAVWTTTATDKFIFYSPGGGKIGNVTIQLPKIVADGNLTIGIYDCQNAGVGTTLIESLDMIPTQSAGAPEGEFHTVERSTRPSSIVKPNQTVFNGDNAGVVYLGAIYDRNEFPTSLWYRRNDANKFPLLRIAAEEELRIAQRPTKIFRGDFYGYIPYLSFIHINNIGYFMPIEWSYNTVNNVTTCKHLELFVPEINDVVYSYTLDYGQTVKPTIK